MLAAEFRIRSALEADLPAVIALEREVREAPHWAEAEYGKIASGNECEWVKRCLLVAENATGVVGFVVGKVLGAESELESIAVAVEARRFGIGMALCEAVVRWCGGEGAKTIELEVRSENVAAIQLYKRMGFVEMGLRKGYYQAPEDDAVLMRMVVDRSR